MSERNVKEESFIEELKWLLDRYQVEIVKEVYKPEDIAKKGDSFYTFTYSYEGDMPIAIELDDLIKALK